MGKDLSKIPHNRVSVYRRKLGVVFQDFRLLKDRNVYENVAFAQRIVQTPTKEIRKNVPSILSTVGLAGKYKARPKQLSGGEQQRVAIARSLSYNPKMIVADEPTGNLDPETGNAILDLLHGICERENTAIIMATHNLGLLETHPGKILKVENNRLLV